MIFFNFMYVNVLIKFFKNKENFFAYADSIVKYIKIRYNGFSCDFISIPIYRKFLPYRNTRYTGYFCWNGWFRYIEFHCVFIYLSAMSQHRQKISLIYFKVLSLIRVKVY